MLVTEVFHLTTPLHFLFESSLRLTTVTSRSLNAKEDLDIFKQALEKNYFYILKGYVFKSTKESLLLQLSLAHVGSTVVTLPCNVRVQAHLPLYFQLSAGVNTQNESALFQ